MLLLSNVSSFHPQNWDTLIPTALILAVAGVGLYLWLRDKDKPHHSSVKGYVIVAVILTVVTIVEIAILPVSESGSLPLSQHHWLVILYVLAVAKFVIVLMFFMHLYFDKWVYTMFFGIGMGMILATLWAVLALMPGEPIRQPEPWEKKAHGGGEAEHSRVLQEGALAGLPAERLDGLAPEDRGALVFEALQCGHCHHVEALPSARGNFGPSLDGLAARAGEQVAGMDAESYVRQSIEDPGAYTPRGFFKGMPELRGKMTDGEFEDLVRYLLTLGSREGASLQVGVS